MRYKLWQCLFDLWLIKLNQNYRLFSIFWNTRHRPHLNYIKYDTSAFYRQIFVVGLRFEHMTATPNFRLTVSDKRKRFSLLFTKQMVFLFRFFYHAVSLHSINLARCCYSLVDLCKISTT